MRALRRPHLWIIAGIFIVVAAYGIALHEQMSDRPWIARYHPIWKQIGSLVDSAVAPSASIVRHEAFFALGRHLQTFWLFLWGSSLAPTRGVHAR